MTEKCKEIEFEKLKTLNDIKKNEDMNYENINLDNYISKTLINNRNKINNFCKSMNFKRNYSYTKGSDYNIFIDKPNKINNSHYNKYFRLNEKREEDNGDNAIKEIYSYKSNNSSKNLFRNDNRNIHFTFDNNKKTSLKEINTHKIKKHKYKIPFNNKKTINIKKDSDSLSIIQ